MASDPITWRNMRPISIADELMAYAKYSGGAGDALKGMGTTIDDLLQAKSTRDTESFLAGADDLPTAEARNAALQQAREGFNLINVGQARKSLRATELHDFARQAEDRQVQAAQLKQDQFKHDVMQDALKQSNEAERLRNMHDALALEEETAEAEQAFKEKVHTDIAVPKAKHREKVRPLELATTKLTLEGAQQDAIEKTRKLENAETVRQSLSVMEEVRRDFKNIPDSENTIRRQLETSIAENKGFGITDIEQKALIDQYNKVLADDRTIKITQDDLDAAFGVGNPPDYTNAGKLRLKDALFSRITADYVHATTDAAETKATNVINKSKYAAKYANPLIASFDKMEAASKPDTKTGAVDSKKVLSTYFKQRKYVADNWTDQLGEFDDEWKDSALNAANVSLDIASLKKTKLTKDDGFGNIVAKLDKDGEQEYSKTLESIIKKPNDQITRTDLARYDKSIKQQLIKLGFRNLTPAEIAIVTKNSEAGIPGLEDKMTSLRALHAAKLEISTGEMTETVAQTLQPSQVETKVSEATQTLITTANHQRNAVVPTQQAYMKYLKESGKDNGIEGTDLDNAIRRLDDILISRAPKLKAGERAHILMNFMKAHSSVQTWTLTPDVIIDFDENGLIETAPAGFGDRQVIDIESNADTNKAFRMMMEKTGLYTYPSKAKAALELMYGNQKTNNDNIIKDNNALLDQLSSSKIFGKTPAGVQAQIDKLKKQIAQATSQNAFLERRRKERGGK